MVEISNYLLIYTVHTIGYVWRFILVQMDGFIFNSIKKVDIGYIEKTLTLLDQIAHLTKDMPFYMLHSKCSKLGFADNVSCHCVGGYMWMIGVMLPLPWHLPDPHFPFLTSTTSSCPVCPTDYPILPPSLDPLITMWSLCLAFASCTISNPYLFVILLSPILPHCFLVYHYSSLACLLIHLLMPHLFLVYHWLIWTSSSSI